MPPLRAFLLATVAWTCLAGTGAAQELPTGGTVAHGTVGIAQAVPGSLTLTQGTESAVVNWQSFSIGSGGHVDIRQPHAGASMLNRVTGDTTSRIHGRLTANGQVHLVNPNGIFIGPRGTVDGGGFVASTLDIADEDFLAGRLSYRGLGSSATVENAGRVTIGRDGYAALLGGRVKNSGVVTVPMGRIAFGSGERAVLDLSGDQFLQVMVPTGGEDGEDALIENAGFASAEGGLIEMRAATAREAVRHAINLDGVAEARSVSVRGGAIVLSGGDGGTVDVTGRVSTRSVPSVQIVDESPRAPKGPEITITGQRIRLAEAEMDASGRDGAGLVRIGGDFGGAGDLPRAEEVLIDPATTIRADAIESGDGGRIAIWSEVLTDHGGVISAEGGARNGDGGFIEVSSRQRVRYAGLTSTRAPNGAFGMTLLDPTNITIDPDGGGETGLEASLEGGSFTLDTTSGLSEPGNITINADLDWSSGSILSLQADNDIAINGSITAPSGVLDIDAVGVITAAGDIDVAKFVLGDGSWEQFGTTARFSADDFSINQLFSSFARTAGGSGTAGDPHQIFDIYGLQGIGTYPGAFVLANDIDASGTSGWTTFSGAGFEPIEGFGGALDGNGYTVSNLFQDIEIEGPGPVGVFSDIDADASVTDLTLANADFSGSEGGILATTNDGTVSAVRVSGTITVDSTEGSDDGFETGGLVGSNFGTVEDTIADVDVAVLAEAADLHSVGGFAGFNIGTIERSISTGDVSVTKTETLGSSISAGGFVGEEGSAGFTINDSYATGDVSVTSTVGVDQLVFAGGFAGFIFGSVNRSFSTGAVASVGDANDFVGGFAGSDSSLNSFGNFWDTVSSGLGTSDGGTGLTTAQFQDTIAFLSLASSQGWDFGTTWVPGDRGFYPAHYATSPVILALPDDVTLQYGMTSGAGTTGTALGGPGSFRFGPVGDTLDTSGLFSSLTFPVAETVGPQPFGLSTETLTSAAGVVYRVVDLAGQATITPAPLTITPTDQAKLFGTEFEFTGTEFTTSGFVSPGDGIDMIAFFSFGTPPSAPLGSYPILLSGYTGPGLENYTITEGVGTMTVIDNEDSIPRPPVITFPGLPNPTDIFEGDIDLDVAAAAIGQLTGQRAAQTFSQVRGIAGSLQIAADSCGQSGGDVGRYLACLSDALDDFANELDAISLELPPGMENVAQIIQTARAEIDGAATRAAARLADATTEAERQAIRRDAANEARAALNTASGEIRKAITLVRAEDPELASLQRATIITVADAVDTVGLELARVTDL